MAPSEKVPSRSERVARLVIGVLLVNCLLGGVLVWLRSSRAPSPVPPAATSAGTTVFGSSGSRAVFREVMARFDANGDGRLSREEFLRYGTAAEFDRYDANQDGFLDVAEYEKAFLTEDPNPAPTS